MKEKTEKIHVKVLILPKFEMGEMSGDAPGEAQFYYEEYCMGSEVYDVPGADKLYYKNGVALSLTGMGKANQASNLTAILLDERFDYSEAYILSTGCGGGAAGITVMGDVVLATATVDYDLGHHVDARDLSTDRDILWFREPRFDMLAYRYMNTSLTDRIYELVKDVKVDTTPAAKEFMGRTFNYAEWAVRDPKVVKGTVISGDNYWKGEHDHRKCVYMAKEYGCPDPFAASEMEDHTIAVIADKMGMLNRLIILRDIVNMDTYMNGATPEYLWDSGKDLSILSDEKVEAADIFDIAMRNNFLVGKVIIDRILEHQD